MAKKFFLSMALGCFLAVWAVPAQAADSSKGKSKLPDELAELLKDDAKLKTAIEKEIMEGEDKETIKLIKDTHYDVFAFQYFKVLMKLIQINGWDAGEELMGDRFKTYYDANDNGMRDYSEFSTQDDADFHEIVPTPNGKWRVDVFITHNDTTDLTPLKDTALGTITLATPRIDKFPKIAGLAPKWVYLYNTSLSDISPINDMPSIESVNVRNNAKLEDLSPIARLPHVKLLMLGANKCDKKPGSYDSLLKAMNRASMTNLVLHYAGKFDCGLIKDMDKLQELTLVSDGAWVGVMGTPLDDIGCLNGKPLEYLNVTLAKNTDLSPLAKLPLKNLVIGGEGVTTLDFVKNLSQLSGLCVHHAPVSDLSPLAGLPLKELALEALPGVTDLAPVASLPQLRRFSARATGVSDVSVLAKAAIVDLDLSNNPKIAALPFIPSVKVLRLFKTKIKDASAWDGTNLSYFFYDSSFSHKMSSLFNFIEDDDQPFVSKLSDTAPGGLRETIGLCEDLSDLLFE